MTLTQLASTLCDQLARDLSLQDKSGCFPGGHNGAYGNPETPVRCTAHYLLTACQAYRFSERQSYLDAARRAADYLKRAVSGVEGSVIMRHAPGRDSSNGVLGPAFVIEALHAAGRILDDAEAADLAVAYYERHSFDAARGYWGTLTPSGGTAPFDLTFNHQLYFATTASLLFQHKEGRDHRIDAFLAAWPDILTVREDGRVGHSIARLPRGRREAVRRLFGLSPDLRDAPLVKERDYHLYNCYAFALLSDAGIPVRERLGNERIDKIVEFAGGGEVSSLLSRKHWGEPQKSGTETCILDYIYFMSVFDVHEMDFDLVEEYLTYTLGPDGSGKIVSPDPVTYRARTYRYWRLVQKAHGWELAL